MQREKGRDRLCVAYKGQQIRASCAGGVLCVYVFHSPRADR